jgi:hypothetical protein
MGDCLMGNVRLYGSTSGYTELAPPAVAPDGVLSLPSGVGTLLTAEGGKVLQVVRATDTTLRSTSSTSFVDASISVTITPTKNTSTILVLWAASVYVASSSAGYQQISDSANVALNGAEGGGFANLGESMDATQFIVGYSTPATTSATTYKGRFRVHAGSGFVIDNTQNTGQLIALEISA